MSGRPVALATVRESRRVAASRPFSFLHVSDTHGALPALPEEDVPVVHSGDFFPNRYDHLRAGPGSMFGVPLREEEYQQAWCKEKLDAIRAWLDGRALYLCHGNHDYFDPSELFAKAGIAFHLLGVSGAHPLGDVQLVGFPYCPANVVPWNYAAPEPYMSRKLDALWFRLGQQKTKRIVLVAHCPPWGICDEPRQGFGNAPLRRRLEQHDVPVLAVLSGHVHEAHGVASLRGILVSNAATVCHRITVDGRSVAAEFVP